MIIRRARAGDASDIAKLHRETIRKINSKDYNKEQIDVWCKRNTNKYFTDALKKRKVFFVALEKNKILGCASISLNKEKIGGLYIKPDLIGKGVGSKLLDKVEDYATKHGLKSLELDSTITAFDFYKSKGYRKIKRTNALFNNIKIPCINMKKVLK